jgi:hypothetical protein
MAVRVNGRDFYTALGTLPYSQGTCTPHPGSSGLSLAIATPEALAIFSTGHWLKRQRTSAARGSSVRRLRTAGNESAAPITETCDYQGAGRRVSRTAPRMTRGRAIYNRAPS